jgi:MFS family permease
VVFGGSGLLIAQAVSRMPSIRDQAGATKAELGFALLGIGLGSVLAMPWTGRLVDRWGSRRIAGTAAVAASVAWAAVPWTGSPVALGLVMLCIGAPIGTWDVSMNVQGHHVEVRRGRSLMPRFHGAYSGGMVLGALIGAGAARAGLPLRVQLPVMSAVVAVAMLLALRWFVADDRATAALAESHGRAEPGGPAHPAERAAPAPGVQPVAPVRAAGPEPEPVPAAPRGITGLELLIGLICLSTAIGEGAAGDWLALLLVDVRAAPESIGAIAYAAFNVTMMLGRFAGGPAIDRLGRARVLRVSGVCAALGVGLVCLVPSWYAGVAGGLLWGLGLAVVFPATMSAAGEVPGRGARAIGVVSTIGYGGFLLGAPCIGLLTAHVGLDHALLVIAGFGLLITLLAGVARSRDPGSGARSHGGAAPLTEPDTTLLR